MFCKKIKYTDYNGTEREEEFYFNLTKAELIRMMVTDSDATLDQVLEYFQQTRNGKQMFKMIEDLIQSSYGVKSSDGRSFIKTPELLQAFAQSEAYSEMIMEMLNDADKAAEFFIGIVPKDLQETLSKYYAAHPDMNPEDAKKFVEAQRAAELAR